MSELKCGCRAEMPLEIQHSQVIAINCDYPRVVRENESLKLEIAELKKRIDCYIRHEEARRRGQI